MSIGFFPNLTITKALTTSSFLHEGCLSYTGWLHSHEVTAILLCGSRPTDQISDTFKSIGIFHLLVVSGAHIALLSQLMTKALNNKFLLHGAHLIYASVCLFSAPILRACSQAFLYTFSHKWRLFLPRHLLPLYSALIVVSLAPDQANSLSLPLSTVAAQTLTIPKQNALKSSLALYVMLFPLLASFTVLSPLTILINSIFGLIFSSVLFPLTFVAAILPFLQPLHTWLWVNTLQLLSSLGPLTIETLNNQFFITPTGAWLYAWLATGMHHIHQVYTKQNGNDSQVLRTF